MDRWLFGIVAVGVLALAIGISPPAGSQPAPGMAMADMSDPAEADPGNPNVPPVDAEAVPSAHSAAAWKQVTDGKRPVPGYGITVGELQHMTVVDEMGEKVGKVGHALENPAGAVAAVVVDVGGFLGIGAKEVVIQLVALRMENHKLLTTMIKEDVAMMPKWEK